MLNKGDTVRIIKEDDIRKVYMVDSIYVGDPVEYKVIPYISESTDVHICTEDELQKSDLIWIKDEISEDVEFAVRNFITGEISKFNLNVTPSELKGIKKYKDAIDLIIFGGDAYDRS